MTALANVESEGQSAFDAIAAEASKAKGFLARVASRIAAFFRAARIKVRAMFARKAADAPVTAPATAPSVRIDAHHGVSLGLCVILCGLVALYEHHAGVASERAARAEWEAAEEAREVTATKNILLAAQNRQDAADRKAQQQREAIDAYVRELATKPRTRTVVVQGHPVVLHDRACDLDGDDARRLRAIAGDAP